jgi:hypothetical protein
MRSLPAVLLALVTAIISSATVQANPGPKPVAGPVEIMKSSEIKPGQTGYAWTVFTGTEPEAVPIEVIGLWKNAWGPKQDIILAKMGGKAQRTNVAGGMSGSPVYIDGKLVGAVALRLSVFSPDAICGITPIELMLEINDFDDSRPADARTPDKTRVAQAGVEVPGELLARAVAAGSTGRLPQQLPLMTPIETPLTFAGFTDSTLKAFGPLFQQLGVNAVQGGAAGSLISSTPAKDWQSSLQPGDAIAGVLVSGDMSVSGLGTVTYNDGKRVLGFGHSFFNLGPVNMPMSRGEVLMVLSSQFQPNKIANATEIVGALRQDRHSGIMGVLGETAEMIPVTVKVRSFGDQDKVRTEKDFRFNVFVQQKWTPYLMMLTLFNSISGLNEFMDESTYRLSGEVELEGHQRLSLATMQAPGEVPIPTPMLLAGWWGDKFNQLFLNNVKTPRLKSVNVAVDLLPERRIATVDNAWAAVNEVAPGEDVPVKVFLQPYRGERVVREVNVKIPVGLAPGSYQILLSDADTLDRVQKAAGSMNRSIDLPQTVSLLNRERSNTKLYVSLLQARPTLYYEDKAMPNLPPSMLNVMEAGRTSNRRFLTSGESVQEQMAVPFDFVVSGSHAVRISVK